MTRCREKVTLTQELLDNIATYMNDDIREGLAFKLAPCTPEMFLSEYIKQDPDFEDLLRAEFGIEL